MVSVTPRQHLAPGKDQVPIVQEAGWASGPVWTGAENLAPPGFDPRTVQPVGSRYTELPGSGFCMSRRKILGPPSYNAFSVEISLGSEWSGI